jgi:hypothetical protein
MSEKINTVSEFTGLSADQTKRFVGALLAVGLEISETSRTAALEASHKELVKALKSLRKWTRAESERFDANFPDDFIWLAGTIALANAEKIAK